MAPGGKLLRCSVKTVQPPVVGADPESTGAVLEKRLDDVIGQAMRVLGVVEVSSETSRSAVPAVQARGRGHPEHPIAVFQQRMDAVSQADRVVRLVAVGEETSRCAIEPVESSATRANPERARAIFPDDRNVVIREAVGVVGIVLGRG